MLIWTAGDVDGHGQMGQPTTIHCFMIGNQMILINKISVQDLTFVFMMAGMVDHVMMPIGISVRKVMTMSYKSVNLSKATICHLDS